jgi:hydrogenase nickel incorporation protein HypA/HybF
MPVRVRCDDCGADTQAAPNRLLCEDCGSWRTRLVSGDEMLLANLELTVPEANAEGADVEPVKRR